MTSTAEIMDKGVSILLKNMGALETEHFISVLIREQVDYTKWQREHFDGVSSDEFYNAAVEFDKTHPFEIRKKN